jgi:hypothetical protein
MEPRLKRVSGSGRPPLDIGESTRLLQHGLTVAGDEHHAGEEIVGPRSAISRLAATSPPVGSRARRQRRQ